MARKTPPLSPNLQMVDENGKPTPFFMRWWQEQVRSNAEIPDISTPEGVTAILDILAAPLHGQVLFRGPTLWEFLDPDGAGKLLQTNGGAADPSWASVSEAIDTAVGNTHGNIIYRNATEWTVLAPDTSGRALLTQGPDADPVWGDVSLGSTTIFPLETTEQQSGVWTFANELKAGDCIVLFGSADQKDLSTRLMTNFTEFVATTNAQPDIYGQYWAISESDTPPTSLTLADWGNSIFETQWVGVVLRGVDPADPLAGAVPAVNTGNSQFILSPPITTDEDGAYIIAVGGLDDDPGAVITAPSNMTGFLISYGSSNSKAMMAGHAQETAGLFTPNNFVSNLGDFWHAGTIAFKPGPITVRENFLALDDTPSAYTGDAGKVARVNTGATALEFATVASLLESISATQGTVLYRSASGWVALPAGTVDHVLTTKGAGANPVWQAVSVPAPSLSIDDLTDVDTSTTPPTDGQALVWVAAANEWQPGTVASGGGGGGGGGGGVAELREQTSIDLTAYGAADIILNGLETKSRVDITLRDVDVTSGTWRPLIQIANDDVPTWRAGATDYTFIRLNDGFSQTTKSSSIFAGLTASAVRQFLRIVIEAPNDESGNQTYSWVWGDIETDTVMLSGGGEIPGSDGTINQIKINSNGNNFNEGACIVRTVTPGIFGGGATTFTKETANRATVTLSGASVDWAIPAGTTRVRFSCPVVNPDSNGSLSISLGAQAFSGAVHNSSAASIGIAGLTAQTYIHFDGYSTANNLSLDGEIIAPRDATRATISRVQAVETSDALRTTIMTADSAADNDTLTFAASVGSFTGTVQIEYWVEEEVSIFTGTTYDVASGFEATPTTSEVIEKIMIGRELTFPADFAGIVGDIDTNPTGSFLIDVQDDGVSIGTITISTGGVFSAVTVSNTEKVVAAGSKLTFHAPVSVDATAAGAVWTLLAQATE